MSLRGRSTQNVGPILERGGGGGKKLTSLEFVRAAARESPTRGLGERRKLSQWGPEGGPGNEIIFAHSDAEICKVKFECNLVYSQNVDLLSNLEFIPHPIILSC